MAIENERLDIISVELVDLRKQSEGLDMRKAELLQVVRDDKLYKDSFGTFADYCASIGYHRSTVYKLIGVYECTPVKLAYTDIGLMAGTAIAQAAKVCDSATIENLVEFAKDHTAAATVRKAKSAKLEAQGQDDAAPDVEDNSTEGRIKFLLEYKEHLLSELEDIESELTELRQAVENV